MDTPRVPSALILTPMTTAITPIVLYIFRTKFVAADENLLSAHLQTLSELVTRRREDVGDILSLFLICCGSVVEFLCQVNVPFLLLLIKRSP